MIQINDYLNYKISTDYDSVITKTKTQRLSSLPQLAAAHPNCRLTMRSLSLSVSIPFSLVSLAWIVSCLPSENPSNDYDVFDTNRVPDSVQDLSIVADMTPSIPGFDSDWFLDAEETPMLIASTSTDLDGYKDQYLPNDALFGSDSIGADIGISSDTSFQLAEGAVCPGENRQLWCCPDEGRWDTCIFYNGESAGICNMRNQYCCSQNPETKAAYNCDKLYTSLYELLDELIRSIGAPGGGLAPGGGDGGFLGLPDLS